MDVVVTGAAGFIGRHLLERLISDGHRCRCLVRSRPDGSVFEHSSVELVSGDLSRPETLEGIGEGREAAFHLAAAGRPERGDPGNCGLV